MPATQIEGAAWRVDRLHFPLPGRLQVRVEILVSDFEKVTLEDTVVSGAEVPFGAPLTLARRRFKADPASAYCLVDAGRGRSHRRAFR